MPRGHAPVAKPSNKENCDEEAYFGDSNFGGGSRRIKRLRDEEDGQAARRRSGLEGRHPLEVRRREPGADPRERGTHRRGGPEGAGRGSEGGGGGSARRGGLRRGR